MCNDAGEALYDRTREHLTTADALIAAVGRQLLDAAKALRDDRKVPANVDGVALDQVRTASLKLPVDADWKAASAHARRVNPGQASAADLPLILP